VLGCGLDSSALRLCPMAVSFEHGYKHSDTVKGGKMVDQPVDYELFKEDRAPCSSSSKFGY